MSDLEKTAEILLGLGQLKEKLEYKDFEIAELKQELVKAKTLQIENWNDFKRSEQKLSVAVEAFNKYSRCLQDCDTEGGGKCICGFEEALDLINGKGK